MTWKPEEEMGPQRMYSLTLWVRRLLVANLLVFLIQKTLLVDPSFLSAFGFDPLHAWERPWTFVTYMFLHVNIPHLVFNMAMLFMFGASVEDRMGGRMFILFYLLCGLGGATLSFLLMQWARVGLIPRRHIRVRVVLAQVSGVHVPAARAHPGAVAGDGPGGLRSRAGLGGCADARRCQRSHRASGPSGWRRNGAGVPQGPAVVGQPRGAARPSAVGVECPRLAAAACPPWRRRTAVGAQQAQRDRRPGERRDRSRAR